MTDCPSLLPCQVLLIFPQNKVIQRPPEKPVQPVPLLVIRWVRAKEASQEFWRYFDDTRVTEAVLAHAITTQHRIFGAIFVATRMSNVVSLLLLQNTCSHVCFISNKSIITFTIRFRWIRY